MHTLFSYISITLCIDFIKILYSCHDVNYLVGELLVLSFSAHVEYCIQVQTVAHSSIPKTARYVHKITRIKT